MELSTTIRNTVSHVSDVCRVPKSAGIRMTNTFIKILANFENAEGLDNELKLKFNGEAEQEAFGGKGWNYQQRLRTDTLPCQRRLRSVKKCRRTRDKGLHKIIENTLSLDNELKVSSQSRRFWRR